MTLEDLANLAEIIGLVAILISLIAIYVQQRKDHVFAKAESQREILQSGSNALDTLLDNPNVIGSMQVCLLDYSSAPSQQQVEFARFVHKQVNLAEQTVYMNLEQLVDDSSHHKFVAFPALLLSTPGGKQYWETTRNVYGVEIVEALEKHMHDHPADIEALFEICPYFRMDKSTDTTSGENEA